MLESLEEERAIGDVHGGYIQISPMRDTFQTFSYKQRTGRSNHLNF